MADKKQEKQKRLKLDEAIREIINSELESEDQVELLHKLFFKTIHPESFCPECDNQMFFAEGRYQCLNCGYDARKDEAVAVTQPTNSNKGVPESVEKILKQEEKRGGATVDKGEKIRSLVDKMNSGNVAPPTVVDDQLVKGSDANVSGQINWT